MYTSSISVFLLLSIQFIDITFIMTFQGLGYVDINELNEFDKCWSGLGLDSFLPCLDLVLVSKPQSLVLVLVQVGLTIHLSAVCCLMLGSHQMRILQIAVKCIKSQWKNANRHEPAAVDANEPKQVAVISFAQVENICQLVSLTRI